MRTHTRAHTLAYQHIKDDIVVVDSDNGLGIHGIGQAGELRDPLEARGKVLSVAQACGARHVQRILVLPEILEIQCPSA